MRRVVADVRRLPFATGSFDVVTASLFLHHFDGRELPAVLAGLFRLARRALVVNDLHRARVPYVFGARGLPPPLPQPGERRGRPPVDPPRPSAPDELRGGVRRGRRCRGAPSAPLPLSPPGRGRWPRGRLSERARDVVVVGGGPAGSAAAIFLAQRGHDVLLLDAARFPRDKVCGESVSPEAWRLLDAMGAAERGARPLARTPCAA